MSHRRVALYARDFGAVGDGATDDTAHIQAALTEASTRGIGTVILDGYTYAIAGLLTLQAGVQLHGQGMIGPGVNPGTALILTNAAAKVWCRGTGTGLRDLWINGNATAPIGLQVGGTAAGDAGSDGYYENVQVSNCTTRNIAVLTAQNTAFINCRSNITAAGGEGCLIDNGVGGCTFLRCEFNSAAAGPNLRIGPNPASSGFPTSNNTFIGCQCEFRADDGPELLIEGGFSNSFFGGAAFHSTAGHTSPVVEVTGNTRTYFDGFVVAGNADDLRDGMKIGPGVNALNQAIVVAARIRGFGVGAYFDVDPSFGRLLLDGPVTGLNPDEGTGTNLLTGTSPKAQVVQDNQWTIQNRLALPGDVAMLVSVITENFSRYGLTGAGSQSWGSGASGSHDTVLARTAAGELSLGTGGLPNTFKATRGVGGGNYTTAGRPAPATLGGGVEIFDVNLGKPIWTNAAASGYVDATGAAV